MKIRIQSQRTLIMTAAMVLALCASVQATIDFSTLDKWRGWRPSDAPSRPSRPDPPQRASQQQDQADNTPRPPDPKEVERRAKLKQERLRQLQANWVPVADPTPVIVPTRTVLLVGQGSREFGIVPSDPISFLAPLGKIAMGGTPIATESLRRVAAILDAAATSHASIEETAFLAEQATRAMEGGTLQVIVGPGSPRRAEAAEAMRPVLEDLGRQQAELERAGEVRHQAVIEYMALQKKGASAENTSKKAEVLAVFKRACGDMESAKKGLAKDEYILLQTKKTN